MRSEPSESGVRVTQHNRPEVSLLPNVMQNESFTVSPCIDCDLPGYLVLIAREDRSSLTKLSDETLARLGPTLARIEAAVQSTVGAEHVYILRFSEGLAAVHFHIFPRTRQLAKQWLASAKPPDGNLNGPYIFAWARIKYQVKNPDQLSAGTLEVAARIRTALEA